MFKIPARIITVDYLGIPSSEASSFRDRAMSELETLQNQMEVNNLKQNRRTVTTGDNIKIMCHISFGFAQATVIIGADSNISINEHACFCTAYGVLAGRLVELVDEVEDVEDVMDHYTVDQSYAANINVCQKVGLGRPKIIETREVRSSGGKTNEKILNKASSEFFISEMFYNIPFTDRYPHAPGELTLILAMPLVDYRPTTEDAFSYDMPFTEKFGAWSPEVNRRRITNYAWSGLEPVVKPAAMLTSRYLASTGMTNILTLDSNIWDGKPDSEEDERDAIELAKELRYTPFRILPIPLDSCFSGYK